MRAHCGDGGTGEEGTIVRARQRGRAGVGVVIAIVALVAASCSNATNSGPTSSGGNASTQPGITNNSIITGSIATETGALAVGFGEIIYGVKAYFDMINAEGGLDGRKLELSYVEDDTGNGTTDTAVARNLVEQDHVFAIVGVGTPFFEGASYLKTTGTPTFGYVVSANWNDAPNLFGAYGSYLDFGTGATTDAYVARALHSKTAAVVALGIAPQSYEACDAVIRGLKEAGVKIGFQDLNFGYGGNPNNDVEQMKAAHVDIFYTCMDGDDNLAFARAMGQYGLSGIYSLWLNGYSKQTVAQNPTLMNNTVFLIQHVPFEAVAAYPGKYPGMETYIDTMKKYEPKWVYDDTSFQGWLNAAQFVAGVKAVDAKYGKNGLTQQRLIDAINSSDSFNGLGTIAPPINWKTSHTESTPPYCSSFVIAKNGKITPFLVPKGGSVITCFNNTQTTPITPPPGTPGT